MGTQLFSLLHCQGILLCHNIYLNLYIERIQFCVCKFKFLVALQAVLFHTLIIFLTACEWTLGSVVLASVTCAMGMSKLEVNLRRLLSQCENMVKEDPQKDWRLDKVLIFV
jgi:hypothetical protein